MDIYFYPARYYDPQSGRFINTVPIGFDRGNITLYAHMGNNPVNYTAPERLAAAVPLPLPAPIPLPPVFIPGTRENMAFTESVKSMGKSIMNFLRPADQCDRTCPPCKTVSGRIVPVGTIGYRPLDTPSRPQHGITGPHYNTFRANQYPYPKCDCFWQRIGAVSPAYLPVGAIPIEPFANN